MSLIKQIKDLESQIAAMQGQLTDAHAVVEDRKKALDDQAQVHGDVLAAKDAEIATLTESQTATAADLEKAKTELAQASGALAETIKERDQVAERVATLTKALADPGFAAAMAQGETPVEGSGEPSEKMTREQANAAYEAITDSADRDKFRAEHREELGL